MPYAWSDSTAEKTLTLWPHQSLTPRGFSWFIGATAVMLTLPLLAVLGSPVVWVLLFFFLIALMAIWKAIMANRAHRSLHEELKVTQEVVHLQHVPSRGPVLEWHANPMWVTVDMRTNGPVANYLTLRGAGREVELGAFLTPEEREELYRALREIIRPA